MVKPGAASYGPGVFARNFAMSRHSFRTTLDDSGALRRLDQVIAAAVPGISRRRARDLIARGSVWVEGTRVRQQGRLMRPGLVVEVVDDALAGDREADRGVIALPPILLDAGNVVVVDKPAGVACEPTRQAAASIVDSFSRAGRALTAVHRLDVDTSGALLLARGETVAPCSEAFRHGLVLRSYLAIVVGNIRGDDGAVDAPLLPPDASGRARVSPVGRPSKTGWRVLARGDGATLLYVVPQTGRTHQIRVHLAHVGHSLVGDHRYATRLPAATHLGLHALRLALPAPQARPLGLAAFDLVAPPPPTFLATAAAFSLAVPTETP
jgi:23S rRNA pseudouridine1911/1915/1917 synthase